MLVAILFKNHLNRLLKFYKTQRLARLITTFLFLLLFASVAIALYFFFRSGFRYIYEDTAFRLPLSLYVYEVLLLDFKRGYSFQRIYYGDIRPIPRTK